jgi:hypothetical protein
MKERDAMLPLSESSAAASCLGHSKAMTVLCGTASFTRRCPLRALAKCPKIDGECRVVRSAVMAYFAPRPYIRNNRSKRGSPFIRARYRCFSGGLASFGCGRHIGHHHRINLPQW